MSINRNRKGKEAEREIVNWLKERVNKLADSLNKPRPEIQRNHMQCDKGGSDIAGLPTLAIEIKHHALVSPCHLQAWWKQTVSQARAHQTPILFYKDKRIWRVRMNGLVGFSNVVLPCLVDISLFDFEKWLFLKLTNDWK